MLFGNYSVPVMTGGLAGLNQLKKNADSQKEVLKADAFVKRETEYFKEKIGTITSAEELVSNTRVLRFALSAYGLEEELFKTAYIKQVLESDLTDPRSAANRISDPRWQSFAQAFVKSVPEIAGPLQEGFADKQTAKGYMVELSRYKTDEEVDTLTKEADIFREVMKKVKTPEDLLTFDNRKALAFVKKTFNLENDVTTTDRQIVEYLKNPAFSAVPPQGWQDARAALSFFDDKVAAELIGSVASSDKKPNSDRVIENVVRLRFENELKIESGTAEYEKKGEDFRDKVRTYTNVDELLADTTSMAYLKKAFNLQNDTSDTATIKTYLTSADSTTTPTGWKKIRDIFNHHEVTVDNPTYVPPTYSELGAVIRNHKDQEIRVGSNIEKFYRFKKEADAFKLDISLSADNQAIISKASTLKFAMRTFGLDTSVIDSQKALKVLNNDYKFNPKSATDNKWKEFQKAYSFTLSENTLRTSDDDIADKTEKAFLDTTYIAAVGNSDPDLRLALYFERRIGEIVEKEKANKVGFLRILGEPPMATAFQRVFNLPSSIGQLDVDEQKKVYSARARSVLGSDDLTKFADKEYRDKFINIFMSRSGSSAFNGSSSNIALSILRGGG